ncbi:MAG: hypothetical protein KAT07_13430 [Calditrichia bacterium]|nr:hypothetical protein [Calditrichia bacterium]
MSYIAVGYSGFQPLKKWITSAVLVPFSLYYIFSHGEYTLIDNANLIIHEAGHFFFGFMGNFIQAAGGTLMQILFPAFLAFYFLRTGYRTGVQIFIFWLGQNLINISVYAADAQVRKLHLLGNGKHDWYYMLRELGILNQCELVGFTFFTLAILLMVVALLLPLYLDNN